MQMWKLPGAQVLKCLAVLVRARYEPVHKATRVRRHGSPRPPLELPRKPWHKSRILVMGHRTGRPFIFDEDAGGCEAVHRPKVP